MEKDGRIRLARAFCSARDRNVPVLRREPPRHADAPADGDDAASRSPTVLTDGPSTDLPELVSCLDYGVRCTGWLCPHFALPTLPPEDLLAEAAEAERTRKRRAVADGRAILERALREGWSIPSGDAPGAEEPETPPGGPDPVPSTDDPRSTA